MTLKKQHLFFIDNLRVFLIGLVVLHHLAITYGAPGDWYYKEAEPSFVEFLIFLVFVVTNQSYFMGFFFMISGYFTPGSYDRKGTRPFVVDRLKRLGIPLLFFIVVISPLLSYTLASNVDGDGRSLLEYLGAYVAKRRSLPVGPLWFVETLLIFSVLYAFGRRLFRFTRSDVPLPSNSEMAVYAFLVGCITFAVRILFPVGWSFELLGLQFPFFAQYIGLYVIGVIAFKGDWFTKLSLVQARAWIVLTPLLILLFPFFVYYGVLAKGDPAPLLGGLNWQSFVYSVWEQIVGVGMINILTVLFRMKLSNQGRLAKFLSTSAYTVFIIHAPVLVFVALLLKGISLPPLLKFLAIAPLALFLCFGLAGLIRKLPLANKIL